MNINSVNKINFSATFVRKVPIICNDENGIGHYYDANLLEFDRKNDHDLAKVRQICNMDEFWELGDKLYHDLSEDEYYSDIKEKRCFVLTENTEENFNDIDKDKVLGIYTIHENKDPKEISNAYFMTNMKYREAYWGVKTKFNGIGHGMDNATKEMYPDKTIYTYSARLAVPFWEKQGYKHETDRRLVYEPNNK